MTANLKQQTARIYRFPVKPRVGAGIPVDMRMPAGGPGRTVPMADFGSGWYHEAAIEKEPSPSHGG